MNTLLTYTTTTNTTSIVTTIWTTWENACETAQNLLLYCVGISDISATWYDENVALVKRDFFIGVDFFTNEPIVYVEDTDY